MKPVLHLFQITMMQTQQKKEKRRQLSLMIIDEKILYKIWVNKFNKTSKSSHNMTTHFAPGMQG
jgi:hypothetical protein